MLGLREDIDVDGVDVCKCRKAGRRLRQRLTLNLTIRHI